jgi:viroplasmin and RNaseH domain-containing protein
MSKSSNNVQEQEQRESSSSNSLSQDALDNLEEIESELETTGNYFKAKAGKTYIIRMDPDHDKIVPTENERFKDAQGNPVKRYECRITHVNNSKEQIWSVSKTVCHDIIEELKKGFTVLRVTRTGSDRGTVYDVKGIS